jgi:hypothetical protein
LGECASTIDETKSDKESISILPDNISLQLPLFSMHESALACFYKLIRGGKTSMWKLLLLTVFILASSIAAADSFRCGRKIVKQGDSASALIKKCGKPTLKYSSKELVNDQGRQSKVSVSNWVYERNRKKDMIVSVRSGNIIKIQVD